jgi:hypothetical protein
MEDQLVCTNCESRYTGNFCTQCGQKRFNRNQFDFRTAMRDVMAEVLDLESTLGKTLRTLFLIPGKLTTDFLRGKQKSYVGPVKLYLIVITINFLVYSYLEDYSLVNIEFLKSVRDAIPMLHKMIDLDIASGTFAPEVYYHQMNQKINEILPLLLYFLIFLQGLVLNVQFLKFRHYYMEHLVFSLHFMAFGFLRDIAILPVQMVSPEAGFVITITTTVVYLYIALKRCYSLTVLQAITQTVIHYSVFFFLFFLTVLSAIIFALWAL